MAAGLAVLALGVSGVAQWGASAAGGERRPAIAAASPASGCPRASSATIAADSLADAMPAPACDLRGRRVTDHGVSVVVPAPGRAVGAEATTRTGLQRLTVGVRPDGNLVVLNAGSESGGVTGAPAVTGDKPCKKCPPPCSDTAHNEYGFSWPVANGPFEWFFKRGSTPAVLTPDKAETAFIAATANVTGADNNCGLADNVDVEATYLGNTTHSANITKGGACKSFAQRDALSVVDFGGLPSPGMACYWFAFDGNGNPTILLEADIRMQRGMKWTTTIALGCNNRYDLEGLATHERAHTFGLDHVGKSHGNLTMSTYGMPECSKTYRTLGLGDVRGLESLY